MKYELASHVTKQLNLGEEVVGVWISKEGMMDLLNIRYENVETMF